MLFWLFIICLTAISVTICVRPLITPARAGQKATSAQIYKQLLQDIEADIAAGILPESERDEARAEAGRRLLKAQKDTENTKETADSPFGRRAAFGLLAVALPVGALITYALSGAPTFPDQPLEARLNKPADQLSETELVARVERELQKRPSDARGWALIAPVYARAGELQKAQTAYRQALEFGEERADLVGELAEVIVAINEGLVVQSAAELFAREQLLNPDSLRPLAYRALRYEQNGSPREALDQWRGVAQHPAAQSTIWGPTANANIARLEKTLEQNDSLPGPSRDDIAAANELSADDRQAMIKGMVEGLAERLTDEGGSSVEWVRLIQSFMVLNRTDDAKAAVAEARIDLAGDEKGLSEIDHVANQLGLDAK